MLESVNQEPRVKWRFGSVPVEYVMDEFADILEKDSLPSYLAAPPRVGDIVESGNERRFEVKEITHVISGDVAVLRLSVGRPTGGTSVGGGGGGTAEVDW